MRILSIVTHPASRPLPTQEEMDRMGVLISELVSEGSLVDVGGTWEGLLEMKIERRANDYSIVDGPFSEAKEVVGGYVLFDVADREAAIAFTRRFLDLAGDATCHLHEIIEKPPDGP